MSDVSAYPILSVCATVGSKLSSLEKKDGQLIFIQDKHRIALDYNGKRVFYNCIDEIETEQARTNLLAPISGHYYFVVGTATLWTYRNGNWIRITTPPEEIVFIGTELPNLGSAQTLYIDKNKKQIAVWDEAENDYMVVSDKTMNITEDDIESLFL